MFRIFYLFSGDHTPCGEYTNCDEVSLYVDGVPVGTQSGKIAVFTVPMTGEHTIEARSGKLSDSITIRKVSQRDQTYILGTKGDVTNWFDADTHDPTCFSIKDKFGILMTHPGTAPIVGAVMKKAMESRGDVATSTSGNANLQKMLAGMSFESLLKQAGDAVPPEAVKALNDALQKVKKS